MGDNVMTDEIFPCPFCGLKGELIINDKQYIILCCHEICQTGVSTKEEAINSWNTRTTDAKYEKLRILVEMIADKNNRDLDWHDEAKELLKEINHDK